MTIIGADYTAPGDIYLNFQMAHKHISNYNPDIFYFEKDTYTFIGKINKDIISDWLNVCLNYSNTLNTNEWYFSPQVKYTYIENLECIIGAGIFSGDEDTWLGSFKNADLLFFDIVYQF